MRTRRRSRSGSGQHRSPCTSCCPLWQEGDPSEAAAAATEDGVEEGASEYSLGLSSDMTASTSDGSQPANTTGAPSARSARPPGRPALHACTHLAGVSRSTSPARPPARPPGPTLCPWTGRACRCRRACLAGGHGQRHAQTRGGAGSQGEAGQGRAGRHSAGRGPAAPGRALSPPSRLRLCQQQRRRRLVWKAHPSACRRPGPSRPCAAR